MSAPNEPCPDCGATTFEPCRKPDGDARRDHMARHSLASPQPIAPAQSEHAETAQ